MTWAKRRELAAQHFGLSEADIVETRRVHSQGSDRHPVYPLYYCFQCDAHFSGEDCVRVTMRNGRVVVKLDET